MLQYPRGVQRLPRGDAHAHLVMVVLVGLDGCSGGGDVQAVDDVDHHRGDVVMFIIQEHVHEAEELPPHRWCEVAPVLGGNC